jgi:hypothetical protein
MISEKKMLVDCVHMCMRVGGGFVHAHIGVGQWWVDGPLSVSLCLSVSVCHPLYLSVSPKLKPEIITKYVILPIFKK